MADRVATSRRASTYLAAGTVLAVTVAWWALALWPLPAGSPAWLERTRAVCFGSNADGLPEPSGWLLLFLQPAVMCGMVAAIWGGEMIAEVRALRMSVVGRISVALGVVALLGGAGLAGLRVQSAWGSGRPSSPPPAGAVRLDRPAPPVGLVDQRGEIFELADFRGRPVLIAFAYAHCQTVCPLIVSDVLAAQRKAPQAAVLIVTLDPWRDTPARLPAIARQWKLGAEARVVSGGVDEVGRVLDDWGIGRSRNSRDGEIVHSSRVYIVDRAGSLAWAATGDAGQLAELVERL